MTKLKVLYVVHNHASVTPGGVEVLSLELYEAARRSLEFEPILLARSGPPVSATRQPHRETPLARVEGEPGQYLFYTDNGQLDPFLITSGDKEIYTRHYADFLQCHRPDVVHFYHTLLLGYDIIRQTRASLPRVPIIYTLQDFWPICHNQGHLIRTFDDELCTVASPRRCHQCFPDIAPEDFFRRQRFIRSHFALVDLFLAPSRFLLERFVDWGIPRDKIQVMPNGRASVTAKVQPERDGPRNRMGFFGQIGHGKGVPVLLRAMEKLGKEKRSDAHLWLHGANLQLQNKTFQDEIQSLIEATKANVTWAGSYRQSDLPYLMAGIDWVIVPSIWWENAPLVIEEAFMHGRPVICSNVGGMAEKVTAEVNGLHFRVGGADSLADTIQRAASTPGLWEKLRRGIPPVFHVTDLVSELSSIYRNAMKQAASREATWCTSLEMTAQPSQR